ncbi:MAG: hypothetical protein ABIO65_12590 [Nitrospiria bacterium]
MLGVVLGALLGVTSLSWALDVKWGGDYRLRGFYIDNLTDFDSDVQDSAAYYSSRFLLTTTVSEDKVSGVVTLIAGTGPTTSTANNHGNRLLGNTPYGPDGTGVDILEAYIKAGLGSFDLKAGRAVYKLGNGIILDDAVDGIWVDFGAGSAKLTVAALKLAEVTDGTVVDIGTAGAGSGTGGDADLYVLNVGLPDQNVNAFLAYLLDRDGILLGAKADLITLGVAADMDLGAMGLRGELDFLTGSYDGGGPDLEGLNLVVGAKLKGAVPIGVDLIYTSGQGTSNVNINGLNGNYPLGIILTNVGAVSGDTKDGTCLSVDGAAIGGSVGCLGGSGLTAVKVSGGFARGAHSLDLAAIWAKATEDALLADTDLGIELDATLTVALGKRLTYLAGVGYFLAGDAFGPSPDNPVVLVNQLNYTF